MADLIDMFTVEYLIDSEQNDWLEEMNEKIRLLGLAKDKMLADKYLLNAMLTFCERVIAKIRAKYIIVYLDEVNSKIPAWEWPMISRGGRIKQIVFHIKKPSYFQMRRDLKELVGNIKTESDFFFLAYKLFRWACEANEAQCPVIAIDPLGKQNNILIIELFERLPELRQPAKSPSAQIIEFRR